MRDPEHKMTDVLAGADSPAGRRQQVRVHRYGRKRSFIWYTTGDLFIYFFKIKKKLIKNEQERAL